MIKRFLFILVLSFNMIWTSSSLFAQTTINYEDQFHKWNLWQKFIDLHYKDGRIIDYYDQRNITTSEGQSYAMFFALVNNDQKLFSSLLNFTEQELAKGSFEKQLPGWLYGTENGKTQLLSNNNAVDSDLWIAYDLIEAARLWKINDYNEKAKQILKNIKENCVFVHPTLGKLLVPGKQGFVKEDYVMLNPSYYPPFLMTRIANFDPEFKEIYHDTMQAILKASGDGYMPDWVKFDMGGHVIVEKDTIGSWNAIRYYLWVGLTADSDPNKRFLIDHLSRVLQHLKSSRTTPLTINFYDHTINDEGNVGFDACMMVLESERNKNYFKTKIESHTFDQKEYYSHALSLFGLGYENYKYSFNSDGSLHIGY